MNAKHPRHIALTGPLASHADTEVAGSEYAPAYDAARAGACEGQIASAQSMDRTNVPEMDFQGLFEASPNPYLVLDRRLRIVGANRAYLAGVKRGLSDIVGRWAWDAFPADAETVGKPSARLSA